jgi:hypothetical protein
MKNQTARSAGAAASDALRCRYLTPTGRRCRSLASGSESGFCLRHGGVEQPRQPADLAPALIGDGDLRSPEGIHRSLAELFTLLAMDRISPRRAAVLAYVGSLLLRTVGAIDEKRVSEKPALKLIWDMPAPAREVWTPEESAEQAPGATHRTVGVNPPHEN